MLTEQNNDPRTLEQRVAISIKNSNKHDQQSMKIKYFTKTNIFEALGIFLLYHGVSPKNNLRAKYMQL